MLGNVISLANEAALRFGADETLAQVREAARKLMLTSLTIVHYQLEKHRAPASAAHLQVSVCCAHAVVVM